MPYLATRTKEVYQLVTKQDGFTKVQEYPADEKGLAQALRDWQKTAAPSGKRRATRIREQAYGDIRRVTVPDTSK